MARKALMEAPLKRRHLLQITRTFFPTYGGVESVVYELARELKRRKWTTSLVYGNNSGNAHSTRQLPFDYLYRSSVLGQMGVPDYMVEKFISLLDKVIDDTRVEIIHAHNLHIPVEGTLFSRLHYFCAKKRIPLVLTAHDLNSSLFPREKILQTLLEYRPTEIVVNSDYNLSLSKPLGLRVQRIYSGVDFSRFRPERSRRGRHTIAQPCRIVRKKGLLNTINALPIILSYFPDAQLLLSDPRFGAEHDFLKEVEQLVRTLALRKNVHYVSLGYEQFPKMYQQSCVTIVAPIIAESQGLTPIESLACGTPVLLYPSGGLNETVRDVPGVLVIKNNNPQSIADGIVKVLKDCEKWSDLAMIGRTMLKPFFDTKVMTKQYIAVYERALEQLRAS